MSPTAELRWVDRWVPMDGVDIPYATKSQVLQQKWVQHHIPAGQTSASFEWRDVPTVKEES